MMDGEGNLPELVLAFQLKRSLSDLHHSRKEEP